MFTKYTNDNRKPNKRKSDIYIIIDNNFFTGESQDLFQIHFETNQIRDRSNSSVSNFFQKVISKSDSLSNFFYNELLEMAKQDGRRLPKNTYLKALIQFGFADSLLDLLDKNTPLIKVMNTEIAKLPDMSKFTVVDQIVICDANLMEIHPSVYRIVGLEMLSLPGNLITTIPDEIGLLRNLKFMNLNGSPINYISDSISNLDRSNGGSLETLKIKQKDIGAKNYKKLKRLLPTTEIS
jgi:Leucine-rich repeat (LRR) protein